MSGFATHPGRGPDAPWWCRFGTLLREQWIFAALLGLVWCGDLLLMASGGGSYLLLAPSATAMALLAVLGRRHPVCCGLAAAVLLTGTTVLVFAGGMDVYSLGLANILPTENAAGLLLVLYAFRAKPPRKAVPVTAVLVVACVVSVFVRGRESPVYPDVSVSQSMSFGFLQLVLAVGTGMYLRGQWPGRASADSPVRALLRRQWPLIAVLSILFFLEFIQSNDVSALAIATLMLCGLVMSGLAVFAPMRPTEAAGLGALALVLTTLVLRVLGLDVDDNGLIGPVPLVATGAGMLLVAFAVRHSVPRRALWATGGLVGAALFALFLLPTDHRYGLNFYLQPIFMGGLLLVISVGTGMYFRARDEERARSVRSAVSDAQQAERMALARELHDVVAHHVTGIVVQAQAAQMVAEKNPKAATDALSRIAESGTEALTAMRRLVASMRGAEPAGASGATEQATTDLEADLRAVVQATQRRSGHGNGPAVDLRMDLGWEVPQEVARSVLRVVQESLTNAEKHALGATRIQIDVRSDEAYLYAMITDDGTEVRHQPLGGSGGYGLVGMRERIELLGGRFWAGPGEHVGWRVEAVLPLAEQSGEVERR
ncbi:two-component sensor histidine kinase [Saccharopolyspora subtropica]|uniref:histidine kinase n=1 Tax=Saccharopolyspora thermophila TaxID=89367 RepID=A0A917K6A3_9PSEU|nr:histidine kinase [Saccharopolyspora subtropica]GGI99769.1 two-component sensor histidine kinase [Saccharopolyspora subtropica]